MAHNVSLQPDTKALLDEIQKKIQQERREKNEYPWRISQDAIVKMALERLEQRPVVNPPARVNFSRGTVYGSGN